MTITFDYNGRKYDVQLTESGGIEVWLGCIHLPSTADPSIFQAARNRLGIPPSRVLEFIPPKPSQ